MYISQAQLGFRKPDLFERMLNKGFRSLGLGLGHNYLLEVQGRKIYRVYSTPVDLLEFNGDALPRCSSRTHTMGT